MEGYKNDTLKQKLADLEGRKTALESELAGMGDEQVVQIHPGLAAVYRRKVAELAKALNEPSTRTEAAELIQGLFTEIRLLPHEKRHDIELVGALASIMALGTPDARKPPAIEPGASSLTMVAGAGFGLDRTSGLLAAPVRTRGRIRTRDQRGHDAATTHDL